MFARYYRDVPAVIVEPGVRTGVPILIDNPKEVGADRVMNTLAAFHLFGGPAIVVDFGTSTNFDVVSPRGEFLGGALAPGIELSLDALAARGAQLRKVELARPRSVIGKSTVEALQSGMLYGVAGQVDGLVRRITRELGPPGTKVAVIATGGLAPLVLRESETLQHHEPDLTLIGLRLVFEKNDGASRVSESAALSPDPAATPAVRPAQPQTSDLPEQMRVRRAKAERLRAQGRDPYPPGYPQDDLARRRFERRTRTCRRARATGDLVGVTGRVMLNRIAGKLCFATLQEGGVQVQVMLSQDRVGADRLADWKADVDLGDQVGVTGEVVTTRRGELSVLADSWAITAKSLRPLPDKHKGLADPEARVRQRYLDLDRQPGRPADAAGAQRRGLVVAHLAARPRVRRGRDPDAAAAARRRGRPAVRDPHERPRPRSLPSDSPGALPQAARRRRAWTRCSSSTAISGMRALTPRTIRSSRCWRPTRPTATTTPWPS